MHEMALSRGLVDLIVERAAAEQVTQVTRVFLEIGALSHVAPEAITFCFDVVSRGTVAEGAKLEIARPPGRAWCAGCAREITIAARDEPCPECGGHGWMVTGGEELRVTELEVS